MDLANQGGFTDEQIALVQGNIMGLMQRSKRFKSIVGGADLRAMMDLEQRSGARVRRRLVPRRARWSARRALSDDHEPWALCQPT